MVSLPLVSAWTLALIALTQPEPPAASQPSSQPAAESATEPASQPAEPEWTLAVSHRPEEAREDKAYLIWCREKRFELLAKALQAADISTAVRYRLAAANLVLSFEIEPYVSRWLLDISAPTDVEFIKHGLDEAMKLIAESAAALPSQSDGDEAKPSSLHAALEALKAFAAAVEAIWTDAEGDAAASARQAAATGLAVLLEDERKEVAAAARLWQALLFRAIGEQDRAFQLLPAATERIGREARFFQFQACLLRCGMVAGRGGHAAAAALLLKLEDSAADSFPGEAEQDAAMHAAMRCRLAVLTGWRAALNADQDADAIQWCDRAAARLKTGALHAGNPVAVLGLERAIPIIAASPDKPEPTQVKQEGQD